MMNMYSNKMKVFVDFLLDLSTLSKCNSKQNAAIIINKAADQIYSIGINGGPKGGMDCLCDTGTKYTCIHAEANAIAKCNAVDQEKIMLCTTSPCVTCAAMIINSGFTHVFYVEPYKDDTGTRMLSAAGVVVNRIDLTVWHNPDMKR